MDTSDDVAAGEVLGLHLVDADVDAGFLGPDAGIHHEAVGHLPQPHGDQVDHADVGAGQPRAQKHAEERENDPDDDQSRDAENDDDDNS